jgi:hypothetical protein
MKNVDDTVKGSINVSPNKESNVNIFNVNAEVADVEVVLQSVAQALGDWEGGRPHQLDLSAVLGQTSSISQQIAQLRSQANIDNQAIIHSTRPNIGPWIIRFQQFVRRFTWWFTDPFLFQIRMFQNQTVTVITKLNQNDQHIVQNVATMMEEVSELQKRLNALESRLAHEMKWNHRNKDVE